MIPEPRIDPPEGKEIGRCSSCGGEIYRYDLRFVDAEGRMYHYDRWCIDSIWDTFTTEEKAEMLDLTKEGVE